MNHEKLSELTTFQHWLGSNYNDLPTDSKSMIERARKYLADTKPVIKNESCSKGLIWTECNKDYDQCVECPNYCQNNNHLELKKVGIIGNVAPSGLTFIEALVRSVEEKTGEKIQVVNIHQKDVEYLTQKIPVEDIDPVIIKPISIQAVVSETKSKGHERPYKFHP